MSLVIFALPVFKDNYIWMIHNAAHNTAIAVDPGDASPVLHFLNEKKATLDAIFITHHHRDHTGGMAQLKEYTNATVFGPVSPAISGIDIAIDHPMHIDRPNMRLSFDVMMLPGHTLDHIGFATEQMVFCGDTLFSAGCGRLFEGTPQMMHQSLASLAALPDPTLVYCSHEYTLANLQFAATVEPKNNTIKQHLQLVTNKRKHNIITLPSSIHLEKQINPFLRCHIPSVRRAAEHYCGQPLTDAVAVFQVLRDWKDHF